MHLVELSRAEHSELKINPDLAEASAAKQHLIPIVASEFRKAATQYPIVFAKSPETGRFAPFVLNGLEPEENLFWSGTKMDVAYVPLNVRRRPFFVGMADTSSGANDNVLCIDIESSCIAASGQKSIVDPDGSDSPYLKEILSIVRTLVQGQEQTNTFISTALSLDLLCPIVLDIVLEDGKPLHVEGLYSIDEDRFRALDKDKVERLWNEGLLDLIYSVIVSTGQIFNLIRLRNERESLNLAWRDNEN
ncbi:MAG TPA: SapC family protein [Steroidobacteraceae bacterium]|nr:SapC family protein [Steroidobacteraceae bacterium]